KVDSATKIITTIAGTGAADFGGDGGAASAASLSSPYGVAVDLNGNIFIADSGNRRVRRINASDGTIATVAGNGSPGFVGDGGSATGASLTFPVAVTLSRSGRLYIADTGNQRVHRVDLNTGQIVSPAGTGSNGFGGEYGDSYQA